MWFPSVWNVIPLLILGRGQHVHWSPCSQWNVRINGRWCVRLVISERVLTQWRLLVAYMKATNLLHWAMCELLPPHCNGNRNSQQSGYILNCCFVDCRHGGCQGDMERVVARWQHPVTSNVALDMLHWALPCALLQRIRMAIKMVCDRGTFAHWPPIFCLTLLRAKDHVMVH